MLHCMVDRLLVGVKRWTLVTSPETTLQSHFVTLHSVVEIESGHLSRNFGTITHPPPYAAEYRKINQS